MQYVVLGVVCLFCPLSLYAQADAYGVASTSVVFLPKTLALHVVPGEGGAFFGDVAQDTVQALPPLKLGRLVGQYAMGVAFGIFSGGVLGGGLALVGLSVCDDDDDLYCVAAGASLGLVAGLTVGSAIGVQAMGDTKDQTAPFLITLGGSALGILAVAVDDDDGHQSDAETLVNLSLPTLGALLAFNASRRSRSRVRSVRTALLNRDQGAWSLTVPQVTRSPDPLTFGRTRAYHFRLLRIGF